MTSSPGSRTALIEKNMIGLPPGTTMTFFPLMLMPRLVEMYSAMASRKSGKPGVGPYPVQPSSSAFFPASMTCFGVGKSGWPIVSYGRNYGGPRLGTSRPEMEEPIVLWIPSIAVSGLTFYTGDVFSGWKRNVFVGGLRQGESPRTGQVNRIEFNEKWEEIRREPMLRELQQRIRDIRQGPDGYLYVLTEEDNAALLRIEPAK